MDLSFLQPKKVVLASQSPRRQELLKAMGLVFDTVCLDIDESFPKHLAPWEVAVYIAENKANAYTGDSSTLLITADTIVCLESTIIGKPKDRLHAAQILRTLSGKKHTVYTGVCLVNDGQTYRFYDQTDVYFKHLSDAEIQYYIDQYRPFDKAGAYGIQEWIGWIAVEKINGSYSNVMGLPTAKLYEQLLSILG